MKEDPIKILIVDDSRVSRELMTHLLTVDDHFKIIGTAENGVEALEFIKKNPPDMVMTDIVMPKMNGFDLTKKIMETHPMPVIVVSGVYNREEIRKSFQAIDAGAIAILEKPRGMVDAQFADTTRFIAETVKLMTHLRLVGKKHETKLGADKSTTHSDRLMKLINERKSASEKIGAVAIGSSVGGPKALQTILSGLAAPVSAPIFIVQHISPGFAQGFADWLGACTKLPVQIPKNGEKANPGHVYIAPDHFHMEVLHGGIISLVQDKTQSPYVPSVGRLFKSVADAYGRNSVGMLLLGAGKDGSKDFQYMKDKGAFTIKEEDTENQSEPLGIIGSKLVGSIEEIALALKLLITT